LDKLKAYHSQNQRRKVVNAADEKKLTTYTGPKEKGGRRPIRKKRTCSLSVRETGVGGEKKKGVEP